MKPLTPFGVRDYLPEEWASRAALLAVIEDHFIKVGAEKIVTPTIEFYDVLEPALSPMLKSSCISFFDSAGDRLVLRPDHTVPIARIAASRLSPLTQPKKFFYSDSVFRKDPVLGETEIVQAGLEYIGSASVTSEAELITLCVRVLEALGVQDFCIDIGHTAFGAALPVAKQQALQEANYIQFGSIPSRGPVETLPVEHPLRTLHSHLVQNGVDKYVVYNQGLIKDPEYYNGIVFECHARGFGKTLGVGGRYDQVLTRFGLDATAIGFAFHVQQLEAYLAKRRM